MSSARKQDMSSLIFDGDKTWGGGGFVPLPTPGSVLVITNEIVIFSCKWLMPSELIYLLGSNFSLLFPVTVHRDPW